MFKYKIATNIKSGEMLNNEMAILNRLKGTQISNRLIRYNNNNLFSNFLSNMDTFIMKNGKQF